MALPSLDFAKIHYDNNKNLDNPKMDHSMTKPIK